MLGATADYAVAVTECIGNPTAQRRRPDLLHPLAISESGSCAYAGVSHSHQPITTLGSQVNRTDESLVRQQLESFSSALDGAQIVQLS